MSRLRELLQQEKNKKAREEQGRRLASEEASICRCDRCGAWTIGRRACSTPFCHRVVEVAS